MATLAQMRQAMSNSADPSANDKGENFNPFKSDGEMRDKSSPASQHSKEESLEREHQEH